MTTKGKVKKLLDDLHQLGSNGGVGNYQLWWLLDDANGKAAKFFPDAMPLCTQLGLTSIDFKEELGKRWKRLFINGLKDFGMKFHTHELSNTFFVAIRDPKTATQHQVPNNQQRSRIVNKKSEIAKAVSKLLFANEIAQSHPQSLSPKCDQPNSRCHPESIAALHLLHFSSKPTCFKPSTNSEDKSRHPTASTNALPSEPCRVGGRGGAKENEPKISGSTADCHQHQNFGSKNNNRVSCIPKPSAVRPARPITPPRSNDISESNKKQQHISIDSAIDVLKQELMSSTQKPNVRLQNLAYSIIQRCETSDLINGRTYELKNRCQDGKWKNDTFIRIQKRRELSESASHKTRNDYIRRKVKELEAVSLCLSNISGNQDIIYLLFKSLASKHSFLLLKKSEVTLSIDEVIALRDYVGTGTNGIHRLKQAIETFCPVLTGLLVPSCIRQKLANQEKKGVIPVNFVVIEMQVKEGKKGMCVFYFVRSPSRMLEVLSMKSIIDCSYEDSFEFSSLKSKLVSVIFNPSYPIKDFLQNLVNDTYQMLIITVEDKCSCSLFLPVPSAAPLKDRTFSVEYKHQIVSESAVMIADRSEFDSPPKIPIPEDCNAIGIQLIHSKLNSKQIIGYRMFVQESPVSSQRFNFPLILDEKKVEKMFVRIEQVCGHVANDGKCINILNGICSNSALCTCPCCPRERKMLGIRPAWMQQWDMDLAGKAGPVFSGPLREGNFNAEVTAKKFIDETAGGALDMTQDERRELNLECGSTFNMPLINIPPQKQNGGFLHISAGIVTHFFTAIASWLRAVEAGNAWCAEVHAAKDEIPRLLEKSEEHKELRRVSRRMKAKVKQMKKKDEKEQANKLKQERLDHAKETNFGHLNLVSQGLEEFSSLLHNYIGSKKPQGPAEWGFFQAVEHLAGGKFCPQHSGYEQTNGNSLRSLHNFQKIVNIVPKMYKESNKMREVLEDKFQKFSRVAKTLYAALTYMKSQDKRDPRVFDAQIHAFIVEWDNTFPDKECFNKLHFFVNHDTEFVRLWEMSGRVSEESFEAIHARLAKLKTLVRCIPSTTDRISTLNSRAQSQLVEEVMENKMKIEKNTKGKKKGPQKNKRKKNDEPTVMAKILSNKIVGDDQFVVLASGNLIPAKFKQMYVYISTGRAPYEWRNAFHTNAPELSIEKQYHSQFSNF